MSMDLQTVIVRKQSEANDLVNQGLVIQTALDAKNAEITRLQELSSQSAYSVEDIDYLLSVDAL